MGEAAQLMADKALSHHLKTPVNAWAPSRPWSRNRVEHSPGTAGPNRPPHEESAEAGRR